MKVIEVNTSGEVIERELSAEEQAAFEAKRDEERLQREADQAAYIDSLSYDKKRALAYPSIADQLDMIFHAGLGGDEFQAAIQAVKDAYPKPE